MNKRHSGFEISRKLLCIVLSVALLVQSGCYTAKVARSLNDEDLRTAPQNQFVVESGQLVRITYTNGKRWEGKLKSVTQDGIVILKREPGKYTAKDFAIPFVRIKRIDVLDRKLDIVASIWGGAAIGFWGYVLVRILTLKLNFG